MGNGEWGMGNGQMPAGTCDRVPASTSRSLPATPRRQRIGISFPIPHSPFPISVHSPFPIPHSPLRTGITLLEVLIAVGVLSIGLLALASLIPIGKYQLAEGAKLDRGSTLGRAAFRNLLVGEWLRPEMWLYAPSNGNVGTPVVAGNRFMPFTSSIGVGQPPMVPLVLDPLMIGMNNPTYGGGGANASGQRLVQTFPYGIGSGSQGGPDGIAPIIPRITLRNVPGPAYVQRNTLAMQPLTPGGAERLFRGTDDLVFNNAIQLQTSSYMSVTTAGVESGDTFISSGSTPTAQYVGANGVNNTERDYACRRAIIPGS